MPLIFFLFLLLLFLLSFTASAISIAKEDEIALLKIKKQLGNPDIFSSWVKGSVFCGRPVSNSAGAFAVVGSCTDEGRVTTLIMEKLEISAPFPDAICDLTRLEFFAFDQIPGLYGPIPSCVTKLLKLVYFIIIETSVSGPVPHFYNNTKIMSINLAHNRLYGSIPPSLSALPKLQTLNLSSNYLTGTVTPGLLNGSSHPILALANNNLTGELPKCYRLVDFGTFDVGNNQLSGDASFLFGKQKNADTIVLAKNNFEFDLSYIEFPDSLIELNISHNKIYGKVPDSLATAGRLWQSQPDLSFNRLCGQLPQGGNMLGFNAEDFANNKCLCGSPLPPC